MRMRGFTLIELMVVVAIIAIIAAIAIPSFNEQVRKSRRSDAIATLGDLQVRQERWRSNNATYGTLDQVSGTTATAFNNAHDHYNFAVTVNTATAYTITATPKGAQSGDRCGTYTIAFDTATRPGVPAQRSAGGSNCL